MPLTVSYLFFLCIFLPCFYYHFPPPVLQEGEVLLKKSLRAEAGSRRMRMHQRIANRVSERARQLREKGSSKEEIEVETTAIRAAGKAEEERIEAVRKYSCIVVQR